MAKHTQFQATFSMIAVQPTLSYRFPNRQTQIRFRRMARLWLRTRKCSCFVQAKYVPQVPRYLNVEIDIVQWASEHMEKPIKASSTSLPFQSVNHPYRKHCLGRPSQNRLKPVQELLLKVSATMVPSQRSTWILRRKTAEV